MKIKSKAFWKGWHQHDKQYKFISNVFLVSALFVAIFACFNHSLIGLSMSMLIYSVGAAFLRWLIFPLFERLEPKN